MKCLTPTIIRNPDFPAGSRDRYIPVPCSKCPNCRKRRAQQWTVRLKEELKRSSSAFFITLTYNDDNVPLVSDSDGVATMSLCTRDLQLFWKRLRKLHGKYSLDKLVYYAVGEYGGYTGRPHYHAIVFNLVNSAFVGDSWKLGTVDVGKVTIASISYVTGYVMKASPRIREEVDGVIVRSKPYMSKGLGSNYMSDAKVAYHKADLSRQYITLDGGQKVSMPRYYRERMFDDAELRKLKIMLKRVSKEDAKRLIDKWIRNNPGKDYDRHEWEVVRAALHINKLRNSNKRAKI